MCRKPWCKDLLHLVEAARAQAFRRKGDGSRSQGMRQLCKRHFPRCQDCVQCRKRRLLPLIFQRAQEIANALTIMRKRPDTVEIGQELLRARKGVHMNEPPLTHSAKHASVLHIGGTVRTARGKEKVEQC